MCDLSCTRNRKDTISYCIFIHTNSQSCNCTMVFKASPSHRLGVEVLAGSKSSLTPSQKKRKSIGRGHAATSSLIPTRSGAAWVICGGSEGATARGREGAESRPSAHSQEQCKGGRAALYLREPWGRRCGGAAPAWRREMRRRCICVCEAGRRSGSAAPERRSDVCGGTALRPWDERWAEKG
jgi:hypothetical protein